MTSISTQEQQIAKEQAQDALNVLQRAVDTAIDRKRRLGQYWVEWDGEKPVKIYPENPAGNSAE